MKTISIVPISSDYVTNFIRTEPPVVKPYTKIWQKRFRWTARDFLKEPVIREIINRTIAESDRNTSNEVMYERAHRKMMALI